VVNLPDNIRLPHPILQFVIQVVCVESRDNAAVCHEEVVIHPMLELILTKTCSCTGDVTGRISMSNLSKLYTAQPLNFQKKSRTYIRRPQIKKF